MPSLKTFCLISVACFPKRCGSGNRSGSISRLRAPAAVACVLVGVLLSAAPALLISTLIASILLLNLRVASEGLFRALRMPYLKLILGSLVLLAGVVMLVEMAYGLTLSLGVGTSVRLFGIEFDAASPMPWVVAVVLLVVGGWLFAKVRRDFMAAWNAVNQQIENRLKQAGA